MCGSPQGYIRWVASGVDRLWMLLSSASAAPLPTAATMAYRHTGKTLSVREPDARPTPPAAQVNFCRRCRRISIDAADARRPNCQKRALHVQKLLPR